MEKIPRLTPDQRSNLVAFVDGELPEGEAKEIEQVLGRSRTVQHEVEMLARTWDLLDQLPRFSATKDFTARTLTAAKLEEAPRTFHAPSWIKKLPKERIRRGAIVGTWVVVLAVAAFSGFWITNRLIPDESRELLENLPVIEKLELYTNAGSIEFLKELDQRIGSFDEPHNIPGDHAKP
jgi:anti-sigma factor RsiW